MQNSKRDILVAAAAIVNAAGDVLLARRPQDVHQGGLWEFPGGKLEPGESVHGALARELAEELGIEMGVHRPLIRVRHCYADRCVVLDVHRVAEYRGEPRGREGQPLVWVAPDRLHTYPMPEADRPIVSALRLPSTYMITPPDPGDLQTLVAGVSKALESGTRLVQLRIRRSGFPIAEAAAELVALCTDAGADLLINGDIDLAESLGCGVHLTSRQLLALDSRPLPSDLWVAASCHSPAELAHACAVGFDFVVLSPVKSTASHPGAQGIGWQQFGDWIEGLPLPVYGLGGMGAADIPAAWRNGAQGVAGIRGLWPTNQ